MQKKYKKRLNRFLKLLVRPWEVLLKEGPAPFVRAFGRKLRLGWHRLQEKLRRPPAPKGPVFGEPKTFDVIVLPIINWGYRFQRPQHLSMDLAKRGCRVFYGSIQVHQTDDEGIVEPQVTPLSERIWEFKFPAANDEPINIYEDELDEAHFLKVLKRLAELAEIREAVLLVDFPTWGGLAVKARERFGWKVVYDCMEDHAGFSHLQVDRVEAKEIELAKQADLVLAVSEKITERMQAHNQNVLLVPNASDFTYFRFPMVALDPFVSSLHPVIGYVGVVTEWFDLQAIEFAARSHPDWNFFILGEVFHLDIEAVEALPNVTFMGEVPYGMVPRYMSFFDVAIIPHQKSRRTDWAGSVKLYEYLSTGRPVVARRLEWLKPLEGMIGLYDTPEELVQVIERTMKEDSLEKQKQRLAFARENTWTKRGEAIYARIAALSPKASIVILTYNNVEVTRLCLESIAEYTDYPNYEVVVVDNASTDDTRPFLEERARIDPRLKVFFNETNIGFAAGNNQGIDLATGDFIVLLNNDTVVTRGWLTGMVRKLGDPTIGAVGPVTNYSGNESRINVPYTSLAEMHAFASDYTRKHAGQSFEINMLTMYCMGLRRDVIEKVGKLDERFGMGMFEDDDYAMRLHTAGYRILCLDDVFIHHFGSVSFRLYSNDTYQEVLARNRKLYEDKWGIEWQPHKARGS